MTDTAVIDSIAAGRRTKLTEPLGTRFDGLDLRDHLTPAFGTMLRRLLAQRGVVVFGGQEALSPAGQVAFTRLLGEPVPNAGRSFELDGQNEITVLSNVVENGMAMGSAVAGRAWHTDSAYTAQPAAYTVLHGIEVPASGGGTAFGDLRRAWRAIGEARRAQLRGRRATYSACRLFHRQSGPVSAEERALYPEVTHPLVRLHPETGEECLYINDNDLVGIEGMDDAEARDFVAEMFALASDDGRGVLIHDWRPGDLVAWDNRFLIHVGLPYDTKRERRRLHRAWTRGEVPIAAPASAPVSAPVMAAV